MYMNNQIFRKKSIEKVTSPEQLNDYLKVSNPGVWMILTSIILLLVGVCVWGVFGRLDTIVSMAGTCKNGTIICYVKEADISKITSDMKIDVNGKTYNISKISESPIVVDNNFDKYILHIGNLQKDEWVYLIEASCDLDDGTYEVTVTVESISPMSFVFN